MGTDEVGDCGEIKCHEPFVCLECQDASECIEENLGESSCMSPSSKRPDCQGTPDGQLVPFQIVGNRPLHWPLEAGCIATSYHSNIADRVDAITAALQAWEDISCSQICFEDLVQRDDAPDVPSAERRIHFYVGDISVGDVPALTELKHETKPNTGWILNAHVIIRSKDDPKYEPISDLLFLTYVGFAIGLETTFETEDSIMSVLRSSETITTNDETAVCTLYGTPSYCGD